MENILSQFNTDNLEIKLTSEKLFIKTITSNEIFALRSINGIGIVDLVEKYNNELTDYKKQSNELNGYKFGGPIAIIAGIFLLNEFRDNYIFGLTIIAMGIVYLLIYKYKSKNLEEPKLKSAIKIMMSGGNRDFEFDKTSSDSGEIANFVANVESTLSAFHQNQK